MPRSPVKRRTRTDLLNFPWDTKYSVLSLGRRLALGRRSSPALGLSSLRLPELRDLPHPAWGLRLSPHSLQMQSRSQRRWDFLEC